MLGLSDFPTRLQCANESAMKAAFFAWRARERGEDVGAFTAEELKSCMENAAPGSPDLTGAFSALRLSSHSTYKRV